MSAFIKDIFREIRKSLGRFMSIFAIVAIGTAFFAGIQASVPDMKYTADKYFDDYNLMDIRIVSTFGLTDEDAQAVREVEGVNGVYPTHIMDVITQKGTSQIVLKLHGIPVGKTDEDNEDYINRVELISGRFPEKSGECLIEDGKITGSSLEIGDKIVLESGTEEDLGDSMNTVEYTVVGTARIPYYISFDKGTSSVGDGSVDNFLLVPEEDFNMDVYTDIFVTVEGARDKNSYYDEYFDITDKITDRLEELGVSRSEIRFEDIRNAAFEELEESRAEFDAQKEKFEKEIEDAESKLNDAEREILEGERSLENEKSEYEKTVEEAQEQIKSAEAEIESAEKEYEQKLAEYNEASQSANESISEMESQYTKIEEEAKSAAYQIAELEEMLENPDISQEEKDAIQSQINIYNEALINAENTLGFLKVQIGSAKSQLEEGKKQLEDAKQQIEEGKSDIERSKQELADGEKTAQEEFLKAEQELAEARQELEEGREELEKNREYGEEELELAEEKIVKAEEDINSISSPEWYVLDRNSHYGYRDYGGAADRMESIAKIFPVFFFVVAALVCLTTMTRMVDEQRSTIGTFKALGYSGGKIAAKYVIYAGIASIGGGITGCLIGMHLFPLVIFNAWSIMYTLPEISYVAQPALMFLTILVAVAVTVLSTVLACYRELSETTAVLMRPKAPKNGKKILLERVKFLWKRLTFIQKVTVRNLFRYKKRFLMTVIGIAGCSALLVAGYGISDSISDVVEVQFEQIYKFDGTVEFKEDISLEERDQIKAELEEEERIEDFMLVSTYNGNVEVNGEDTGITIMIPEDVNSFGNFLDLRERKGKREIELSDTGVIVTEKLAKDMELKIGDSLSLENELGDISDVKVDGIAENYVGHYVFMTAEYYRSEYRLTPEADSALIKVKETSETAESELGQWLMGKENIVSVSFNTGISDSFNDMIKSLNIVTLILIISSGALAFVVLYNLTNVNISERLREIATIKVLGFYDREVSAYVYRENVLLTIIGALVGLALGVGLHGFIMDVVELDNIMFGRAIYATSFLFAFLLTMLFSVFVNLVMYRKLKNIPMVESLKSIE